MKLVEPSSVLADLRHLARFLRVKHVRIIGGEPLLHPELLSVISAIRASKVTAKIRVVTNGVFLQRFPPGIPRQRGAQGLDYPGIQKIEAVTDIERWLNPATALRSCEVCAGSVGCRHAQQQIRRESPGEEGIDFDYLEDLEKDISVDSGCSRIVAGFEG